MFGDHESGGTLDLTQLTGKHRSQAAMVEAFGNDDSIFKKMQRARRVQEDEPEKQKVINKFLWYFADKTLEETQMVFDYVTDGRWKPDYKPPELPPKDATPVNFDDEEEAQADAGRLERDNDDLFQLPLSIQERMQKRMKDLGLID